MIACFGVGNRCRAKICQKVRKKLRFSQSHVIPVIHVSEPWDMHNIQLFCPKQFIPHRPVSISYVQILLHNLLKNYSTSGEIDMDELRILQITENYLPFE